MKLSRIAIATSFSLLAIAPVRAEEYDGVLQIQSTRSRSEVRAEAVEAAHARNQNADAASSVVAAAPTSPRDRSEVRAQAIEAAHARNQNADAASSVVAAAPTSPRDRAAVQAEAVAHAQRYNLRVDAFANSRIPSYHDFNKAGAAQAPSDGSLTQR